MTELTALIPAYQAATSIAAVVRDAAPWVGEVLVVDDGSTDGTAEAARAAGARVLQLPRNLGKGAALRHGFREILRGGKTAAVVTLDADGQHDPSEIPKLVRCWQERGAKLVIGARAELERRSTPLRRFGNRFSHRAVSWFAGHAVPDPQSGFRLYDGVLLRSLRLRGHGYEMESEVIVRATRAGWRVDSVLVDVARVDGTASSHYRPWRDTARICTAVVAARLTQRAIVLWAVGLALHSGLIAAWLAAPSPLPLLVAACVAFHGVMAWGIVHPRSRLLVSNRSRLDTDEHVVALTFDDGPHPEITPQVLEILRERGVLATFFLIGKWVERHPEVARRILAEGHTVGNHSQTHPYTFWALGLTRLRRELQQAQRTVETAAGHACRLFRAPVGLKSPFLARALAQTGLDLWSWDLRRIEVRATTPGRMKRLLERTLRPGSVLLLHDGHDRRAEGNPALIVVLPQLLDALAELGYRCVPLEGLSSPPTRRSP